MFSMTNFVLCGGDLCNSLLWSWVFSVHVSDPYRRMHSTVDRKMFIFMLLGRFDFHILSSLLHAFQASAFLILKSFSDSIMCEPRYLKSSTCFNGEPSTFLMVGSNADEVIRKAVAGSTRAALETL